MTDCPTITLVALAASLRAEVGLRGLPADVKWVGDPRACRQLTDAARAGEWPVAGLQSSVGRSQDRRFYLVRLGPVGEWVIGPDFRLVTTFVNQS